MRTHKLIIALVLAVCMLGSSALLADGAQPWHISYKIGGAHLDGVRDTRDGDIWNSFGFGYYFNNNFSLDIEYDWFDADYEDYNVVAPGATYDKWKLANLGLVGRYYFTDNTWRPFVLGGVGKQKHRSVLDTGNATTLSWGFGLAGQLSKHWSANAQLMWRRDSDSQSMPNRDGFDDFYFSLGLSFDFGGSEPAPPPPPPPAAAPPPPPPNPDLDGDGVPNERDKCPNTRPGAVVDLDGCEVEAVISLEGVHFDFDKSTLRPEAIVILNKAVALLKQHERVVVEVAGHTDSIGTEQYNVGLSDRRANSVMDYLISQGIKASRLTARGYGESQPVASNDTEAGRALNRRVELIVLDR